MAGCIRKKSHKAPNKIHGEGVQRGARSGAESAVCLEGSGGAAAGHQETIALKYTLQRILRLKVCREEFKASYADVETAFENLLRGNKT